MSDQTETRPTTRYNPTATATSPSTPPAVLPGLGTQAHGAPSKPKHKTQIEAGIRLAALRARNV